MSSRPEQILTENEVTAVKVIQYITTLIMRRPWCFQLFVQNVSAGDGVLFCCHLLAEAKHAQNYSKQCMCISSVESPWSEVTQLMFHLYGLCMCVFIT